MVHYCIPTESVGQLLTLGRGRWEGYVLLAGKIISTALKKDIKHPFIVFCLTFTPHGFLSYIFINLNNFPISLLPLKFLMMIHKGKVKHVFFPV